jgi:hypothetical protein
MINLPLRKLTSTGTQPNKGKGKLRTCSGSLLSGIRGSASEAEVGFTAMPRDNLLAMADWADSELDASRHLKGTVRAKQREQPRQKPKHKKPTVVIEQDNRAGGHPDICNGPFLALRFCTKATVSSAIGVLIITSNDVVTGKKYLCHRVPKHNEEYLRFAEEGQCPPITSQKTEFKSSSQTRVHAVVGLLVVMLLTVTCAYHR